MRPQSQILSAALGVLLVACAAPSAARGREGLSSGKPSFAAACAVPSLPQTANRKRRGARKRRAASSSQQQKGSTATAGTRPSQQSPQTSTPTSMGPLSQMTYELPIRKAGAGEARAQGLLTNVECDARGVTFNMRAGARSLKLRTADLNSVQFTTYTPEVSGEVTCGARNNNVVVIYRPTADAKFDGNLIAVQFVPKDFVLKD